jgi:hypothetical protein
MWRIASSLLVVALLSVPLAAQEKKKELTDKEKKAVEAVDDFLSKIKGAGAGMSVKNEEAVGKLFPDYIIVNARYRLFPVAKRLPEGMRASNLFAVDKEGKLEHLKDVKTLEKFFRAHAPAVKNEKDAKAVLAAWLTLTPEFHQDGMFKFEVLEKEFALDTKEELKVSGRVTVMAGGNGELKAVLQIDKDGKVAKSEETAKIRPGPRPICQATKLLDPDPLVRRICEQDLLIMGLSARDYLMEQRARATPELREAIDRVWQQIQKNGW